MTSRLSWIDLPLADPAYSSPIANRSGIFRSAYYLKAFSNSLVRLASIPMGLISLSELTLGFFVLDKATSLT